MWSHRADAAVVTRYGASRSCRHRFVQAARPGQPGSLLCGATNRVPYINLISPRTVTTRVFVRISLYLPYQVVVEQPRESHVQPCSSPVTKRHILHPVGKIRGQFSSALVRTGHWIMPWLAPYYHVGLADLDTKNGLAAVSIAGSRSSIYTLVAGYWLFARCSFIFAERCGWLMVQRPGVSGARLSGATEPCFARKLSAD